MKYFYRLGAFEPSGSYHDKMIEINEMKRKAYSQIDTSRGMMMIGLVNNMEDMVRGLKPEIPKKFRHFGYDIRDHQQSTHHSNAADITQILGLIFSG